MRAGRAFFVLIGGLFVGPGILGAVGRVRRALLWIAGFIASAIATTFWFPCAIGLAVCYLGPIIDATVIAYRFDDVRPRWRTALAIVAATIAAALATRAFVLEGFKLPATGMSPTLEIGDHLFIDKLSPHWRGYERGEAIVFVYPCGPDRDYIKRIVAVAGDTVEVRCHIVYVNGKAAPATLLDAHATYADRFDNDGEWVQRSCTRYREQLGGHAYDVFHEPDRPQQDAAHQPNARDFPVGDVVPSCANSEDRDRPMQQVLGTIVAGTPSDDACAPQAHYVVPAGHVFVLGDNRNNSNDSRIWGSVPVSAIKGRVIGIWLTDNPQHGALSRVGPID